MTRAFQDSTGRAIGVGVGDRVSWRGQLYTIKAFGEDVGRSGTHAIVFEEPLHLQDEIPDEIAVDLVEAAPMTVLCGERDEINAGSQRVEDSVKKIVFVSRPSDSTDKANALAMGVLGGVASLARDLGAEDEIEFVTITVSTRDKKTTIVRLER